MSDPIVITGVGAVSPLGTGGRAVWRAFAAGESGIRTLADDDERLERGVDVTPPPAAGRAGWVRGFRPREHILSPQLRRMDWCSRMLVASDFSSAILTGARSRKVFTATIEFLM